jgi:hypothetical protein
MYDWADDRAVHYKGAHAIGTWVAHGGLVFDFASFGKIPKL